eukprot:c13247_g1_i1.p1 GENE.c13247_g1_i1~~c13247_g1_i1.p1  ORF type:complete len:557 (-),score=154.31 c13247_g1_i1:122-1792(-)
MGSNKQLAIMKCIFLAVALLPLVLALPTNRIQELSIYESDVAPLFALNDPAGEYAGSETILGEKINAQVNLSPDGKALNISFTGVLSLTCDDEPYTYHADSNSITLDNEGKADDCLTKALNDNKVTLESITYSTASDQVNIKAKFSLLNINFVLNHVPTTHKAKPAPRMTLAQLFDEKFSSYALKNPSGTYVADQNIFGLEITSTIVIGSDEFNFEIASPISVTCPDEAYTIDGSEIVITNFNQPGDCMGGLSQQWDVTLSKLTFDDVANTVTAAVSFAGLPITLTYTQSHGVVVSKAKPMFSAKEDMLSAIQTRARTALADPAGEYKGSKSVMGQTVDTVLVINSDGTLNFQVSGVVSINCNEEAFTFANNDIAITNINNNGDCVHDALSTNHVTLKEIAFNSASNEVTVTLKYSVVSIVLPLEHVNQMTLAQLYEQRHAKYALADPTGKYNGKVSFLAKSLEVTAVVHDDSHTMDLTVISTNTKTCPGEAYTYDSSTKLITLPGASQTGNCIYEGLKSNNAALTVVEYSNDANNIYFEILVNSVIPVGVTLNPV